MNLNSREVSMISNVVLEYIQIFGEAEDTRDYTQYMLETGLGSAMKKILKNRNGIIQYEKYPIHRDGYNYPTFEEWLATKDNSAEEEEE